jgi:hypothetical protein
MFNYCCISPSIIIIFFILIFKIHFVHYNGIYSDLTRTASATNGLAVLSFLFQIIISLNIYEMS